MKTIFATNNEATIRNKLAKLAVDGPNGQFLAMLNRQRKQAEFFGGERKEIRKETIYSALTDARLIISMSNRTKRQRLPGFRKNLPPETIRIMKNPGVIDERLVKKMNGMDGKSLALLLVTVSAGNYQRMRNAAIMGANRMEEKSKEERMKVITRAIDDARKISKFLGPDSKDVQFAAMVYRAYHAADSKRTQTADMHV